LIPSTKKKKKREGGRRRKAGSNPSCSGKEQFKANQGKKLAQPNLNQEAA
jgi:hypothetical protein